MSTHSGVNKLLPRNWPICKFGRLHSLEKSSIILGPGDKSILLIETAATGF